MKLSFHFNSDVKNMKLDFPWTYPEILRSILVFCQYNPISIMHVDLVTSDGLEMHSCIWLGIRRGSHEREREKKNYPMCVFFFFYCKFLPGI